jgi:hypothetical protein
MRILLFPAIIIFMNNNLFSQTTTEWFPADLNIQPFTAHFLEPKTGFQYLFDLDKVRIDIGTSHDIIHWITVAESFSIGADFFTYTRARSENNFKFPVETVDYLFGVNGGYKNKSKQSEWGARLRFSHISAHLVDGYYDAESGSWINGREPFVYSREFFEVLGYYKIIGFRFYAGMTFNVHILPEEIKKDMFQTGFDYYPPQLRTAIFSIFIAYDFKLTGIDEYSGNNIVAVGLKFGQSESRGLSILASYFSGKSVHSEFYDVSESYFTLGINLDI